MKGFVQDIESLAVKNDKFRQVLYTAKSSQLVLMSLKPREDIGAEIHKVDQFFRVEQGTGEAVLNGARMPIHALYELIELNNRHTKIIKLLEMLIEKRTFARWSMG